MFSVFAPLAQLDRVTHYECGGLGFESLMVHQIITKKPLKIQCVIEISTVFVCFTFGRSRS